VAIYTLTKSFPPEERYGLSSQMRRAAVSIPSNIAEGSRRSSKKDFRNFLLNAYGSGAELETQCEIITRLSWGSGIDFEKVRSLLDEVMRMLNKMTVNMYEKTVA
jgi:four helix bundle protein